MTKTVLMTLDTTSPRARKWYWRIIRFPLVRIVLATIFVIFLAYGPFGVILYEVFGQTDEDTNDWVLLLAVAAAVSGGMSAYWVYVKYIEWRTPDELSRPGAAKETGLGIIIGIGLLAVIIGIIALAGGYRVLGMNPPSVMITMFAFALMSGCVEEIITRGIIYRIVEESLGTWISTIISAALFGFLHMGNPNATTFSSIAIAVSAGPLLAGAYVLTRRLWLCMGLHFGWNFALGGIFGASVSGTDVQGLLKSELSGPELLTGGSFGPEASIVTIVLVVALSIVFFVMAIKRGRIVKAFWNRRPAD